MSNRKKNTRFSFRRFCIAHAYVCIGILARAMDDTHAPFHTAIAQKVAQEIPVSILIARDLMRTHPLLCITPDHHYEIPPAHTTQFIHTIDQLTKATPSPVLAPIAEVTDMPTDIAALCTQLIHGHLAIRASIKHRLMLHDLPCHLKVIFLDTLLATIPKQSYREQHATMLLAHALTRTDIEPPMVECLCEYGANANGIMPSGTSFLTVAADAIASSHTREQDAWRSTETLLKKYSDKGKPSG